MIPQLARQLRAVLIACMIIVPGLPEVRVAHSSELATGSVKGTVNLVWGDRIVPVAGARLELMRISDEGGEYQDTTDATGRYTIALPPGTYNMRLEWMGGDCAEINRASFRLDAGAHLTFDFLVMQCPISDPVISRVLIEEQAKKSTKPQGTNPMNVPMPEQTEKYQEQLIPAERNRWPEMIVSFGKYDNQVDEIRYFPRHQVIMNPFAVPDPPIPLSLPVIITVDRYTLRASHVVLNKKTMVFKAKGEVSISDGKTTNTGTSAKLSFSNGLPRLEIKR
jgi:Carboxypeptidase regulatory-like domain